MNKADKRDILASAEEVLNIEAKAISEITKSLGKEFLLAVDILYKCRGRVVTSGMGKAGIIAQKFSATLSSTGTPSIWLHPAEALHGDLGRVSEDDTVVILSYSGETEEIRNLIPFLKRIGTKIVALTGNLKSTLVEFSDVALNVGIEKEACPLGLAPTTSTTVMLVLCDALSVVLQKLKGFRREDFALFHPRGSLGKRLFLRVSDIMRRGKANPAVPVDMKVSRVLVKITQARAGAATVVDKKGRLAGIFTDGDLRRHLKNDSDLINKAVGQVMTKNPVTVSCDMLASEAMLILQKRRIDEVPVVGENSKPVGMLDIQDLLKAGIF